MHEVNSGRVQPRKVQLAAPSFQAVDGQHRADVRRRPGQAARLEPTKPAPPVIRMRRSS